MDGKTIGSCLVDLYSVNWMEDSDAMPAQETLATQFDHVKNLTTKSHVTEFGSEEIAKELVTNFQGSTDAPPARRAAAPPPSLAKKAESAMVDSRDAELRYAFEKFMRTEAAADAAALTALMEERTRVNARFARIEQAVAGATGVGGRPTPARVDMRCQHAVLDAYYDACADGRWTTSELRHGASLAKLCDHTRGDDQRIGAAIRAECGRA